MDPHVVFDCQKVLPNRFALTLAAAARSRALARGAEPQRACWASENSNLSVKSGWKAISVSPRSGFPALRWRLGERRRRTHLPFAGDGS